MANIYDMSDTWNDGVTTFTAIKMNVTDTASASGSLLMDLQVNGASQFKIGTAAGTGIRFGVGSVAGALGVGLFSLNNTSIAFGQDAGSVGWGGIGAAGFVAAQSAYYGWGSSALAGPDLFLYREAANTLAQRNGPNQPQTFNLYGTYTDSSNHRRLVMTMSGAGVAEIKPDGSGTGASGNVLHISGLPTANPGPGILWNNAGTVEVGT
jgi:hypothetical protein